MWKFTIAHKTENGGMTMDTIDVLHASLDIAYSKENHNRGIQLPNKWCYSLSKASSCISISNESISALS